MKNQLTYSEAYALYHYCTKGVIKNFETLLEVVRKLDRLWIELRDKPINYNDESLNRDEVNALLCSVEDYEPHLDHYHEALGKLKRYLNKKPCSR